MMKSTLKFLLIGALLVSCAAYAQDGSIDKTFGNAADSIQKKLESSLAELNAVREQAANEKIPLSRKLSDLESELSKVRLEYQQTTRQLDNRTLDLSNLRTEIKSREGESTYLSSLLGDYIRNFESRLHISEIQRYEEPLDAAKLALENSNLSEEEVFQAQAGLVSASLERLYDALGGSRFDGTAVDPSGLVKQGNFVLIGPAALFLSDDGNIVGTAEQRLGSLEPAVIPFDDPAQSEAAAQVVTESKGQMPLDPTLGNAHKIEETSDTFLEHVQKGGVVMYPIFAMAGAALLVALLKWLGMMFVRTPSQKRINALLEAVALRDEKTAKQRAKALKGPVGRMLAAGIDHLREPRELIEEVMYEKVLVTRLKLERFLPFIAISAASAPLLGLLGTVTGIINTFKLITVFGSGDVKMLSGGISEALITTEYGLIVAIPSLLIHAFLSRKARGVINHMEKAAVALVNQVGKTPLVPTTDETALLTQDVFPPDRQAPTTIADAVHAAANRSASEMMDERIVWVDRSATVADAINKVRSADENEDIDSVYVVDDGGKYLGRVSIQRLLTRPEDALIEALTDPNPPFVRIGDRQNEIKNLFDRHGMICVPVLDEEDRLVGRIPRCIDGNGNENEL